MRTPALNRRNPENTSPEQNRLEESSPEQEKPRGAALILVDGLAFWLMVLLSWFMALLP